MTWTGPRCPHCQRALNAWGRVCCDCAEGTKSVAGQTENRRTEGRMEGVDKSAPAVLQHCDSGASPNDRSSTNG